MDKYIKAIVGYEKYRTEIKKLTDEISRSMTVFYRDEESGYSLGKTSCTCGLPDGKDCLGELWAWNREYSLQYQAWHEAGGSYIGPFVSSMNSKPNLCESGINTQELVEARKLARINFGRAKTRISLLAKPFIK